MSILQAVSGLLLVLGLIVLATLIFRWARQHDRLKGFLLSSKRLSVTDRLALDTKRNLVIVKCDQQEYLILLGASCETVLTNNKAQTHETTL